MMKKTIKSFLRNKWLDFKRTNCKQGGCLWGLGQSGEIEYEFPKFAKEWFMKAKYAFNFSKESKLMNEDILYSIH